MVLGQDRHSLIWIIEYKTPIDAQKDDYSDNSSNEPFLIITGCGQPNPGLIEIAGSG